MKLPNAKLAVVEPEKIRAYCLNPSHPRGKHKARVFKRSLGLTKTDTTMLIDQIKEKILLNNCKKGEGDMYGQRYLVDILIKKNNKNAIVRTCWIIKKNETIPRLTSCNDK